MSTAKTPVVTEKSSSSPASGSPPEYFDCPVERDVLGRHSWTLLHTMAATIPEKPTRQQQKELSQFVTTLSKFYPCEWCADEFRNQYVKTMFRYFHLTENLLKANALKRARNETTSISPTFTNVDQTVTLALRYELRKKLQ